MCRGWQGGLQDELARSNIIVDSLEPAAPQQLHIQSILRHSLAWLPHPTTNLKVLARLMRMSPSRVAAPTSGCRRSPSPKSRTARGETTVQSLRNVRDVRIWLGWVNEEGQSGAN